MALDKDETFLRIETAREQEGERLAALPAAFLRFVVDGQRVEIGDKIIAVIGLLQMPPVLHRAEIVPEGECAGRLNAAEDDFAAGVLCCCDCHDVNLSFI